MQSLPHPGPLAPINCPSPPTLPCDVTNPPTVTATHVVNGSGYLAQEVKLVATPPINQKPSGYQSVHVLVEKAPAIAGPWSQQFNIESIDAITNAGSGETATIGVTGLPLDTYLRYRVAFCRKSGNLKGCHCWSDPGYYDPESDGTPNRSPNAFSGMGPSPPGGMTTFGEDHFRRPHTTAHSTPGDGLGTPLWIDNIGNAASQPKIADVSTCPSGQSGLSECAEGSAGLFGYGYDMPSANTYADLLVRPKATFGVNEDPKFNVALNGRYSTGYGPEPVFAQVKFFKGFLTPCDTTLVIMSHTEFARLGDPSTTSCFSCLDYWAKVRPTPTTPMPDGFCWQGSTTPPRNEYFWIRSVITDNEVPNPVVSATVAWNCTDGQQIGSCAKIQLSREFSNSVGFQGVLGRWYVEPHDNGVLVDLFRAGITPTP